MIKKHKMNRNNKIISPPQMSKRDIFIRVGVVLAAVMVVCAGFWRWKTNNADASSPTAASTEKEMASQVPAAIVKPDFEKLKGRWLRPDGDYTLEIKQVADDGKIDVVYLNPRKINVAKAVASSEAGQTKVFVELRDQGYPGNYYTLTYDAGNDQLAGVYYHLGIQQQFDVVFVRTQ